MIRYKCIASFTKRSLRGEPFTVYREEPLVPRIDDKFLDCSAYLYPCQADAERGERIGATAFLVAVPGFGPGWLLDGQCPWRDFHHCYIVSNRHVAQANTVVRLNTDDGRFDVLPFTSDDWAFSFEHDLAVVPIEYNKAHNYLFVTTELFLTKEKAAHHDVGIGDEVFMVGRFISHDGKQRNSPSIRSGRVAMMPGEPVHHPSNPTHEQVSFLVEMRSISGYSGSPVFVRPTPTEKLLTFPGSGGNTAVREYSNWPGMPPMAGGPWLLGVDWGYINKHDEHANNSGVSGVVPAWHLLDLLNTDRFVMQRKIEQESAIKRAKQEGTTETNTAAVVFLKTDT